MKREAGDAGRLRRKRYSWAIAASLQEAWERRDARRVPVLVCHVGGRMNRINKEKNGLYYTPGKGDCSVWVGLNNESESESGVRLSRQGQGLQMTRIFGGANLK